MGTSTADTAPPVNIQVNGVKEKKIFLASIHTKTAIRNRFSKLLKEITSSVAPVPDAHNYIKHPTNTKAKFLISGAIYNSFVQEKDNSMAANNRRVSLAAGCCKVMVHILLSTLVNS